MTDITGGELLARALANEGVKFVFGLPCPEIDPLLAALDGNGIRFVTIRHEAAAAHMAEGLYKTTGQVAVVLGNPGPGSANLVPGVLTARHIAVTRPGALPSTRPNSYHGITEFGMLGTGIPSANGAKLGAPERDVVCVTGDGAAGFNAMELQTAARENLDVTYVVMAESEWTMEIPNEMSRWGTTFGTSTGEVRWDKVAEGLGCHGEYVDAIEALPGALVRCKAHRGPALVCVRTSKQANLAVPEDGVARFFEVYFGPSA